MSNGGRVNVFSGGNVVNLVLSAGAMDVIYAGGTVSSGTILGATEFNNGTAVSRVVGNAGVELVYTGAVASARSLSSPAAR